MESGMGPGIGLGMGSGIGPGKGSGIFPLLMECWGLKVKQNSGKPMEKGWKRNSWRSHRHPTLWCLRLSEKPGMGSGMGSGMGPRIGSGIGLGIGAGIFPLPVECQKLKVRFGSGKTLGKRLEKEFLEKPPPPSHPLVPETEWKTWNGIWNRIGNMGGGIGSGMGPGMGAGIFPVPVECQQLKGRFGSGKTMENPWKKIGKGIPGKATSSIPPFSARGRVENLEWDLEWDQEWNWEWDLE
ncbi:hypothetical protein HGM15179_018008 [Zosterops borbonicus]|uniref:Uncharacterized protein n=1 Tax=Zosterops borbonicus TaxID=364589 RepID=A0A8K1FZW9_9PASS|nr:hypothetical protein HGM15179_018008 [Zosterops borbonicus]